MVKRLNKQGQFQLSFGMIFSVILIISFLVVAFIVIKSFLGIRCDVEQGLFIDDLQDRLDVIWRGGGAEEFFDGKINGCEITYVCFWDPDVPERGGFSSFTSFSENGFSRVDGANGPDNLYFYPRREADIQSVFLEHVSLESMEMNPTCYKEEDGKFEIPLKKNLNEDLIRIS
ncbi:hypothetical protein CMI46_02695 [Candidatus Pacearchaeota archaeon]|nr:hypothetical protein [Candidatus Pacearchaeota archaeon]